MPNLYLSIDTFDDLKRVKKSFFKLFKSPYSDLYKIIKNKKKIKIKKKKLFKNNFRDSPNRKKIFPKKIKISQARANNIMNTALRNVINFDTAHDYGNSEKYIGNFKVKNKKKSSL